MLRYFASCLAVCLFAAPALADQPKFRLLFDPNDPAKSNRPFEVSGDGKVVVGRSFRSPNGDFDGAFRWTLGSGTMRLPDPATGEVLLEGLDVSFDGSVIVGGTDTEFFADQQPFRWTTDGGSEILPFLRGNRAVAVSADGTTAVGGGVTSAGEAFRWTETGGTDLLNSLCSRYGSYWALDVSADGSKILGSESYLGVPANCDPFDPVDLLGVGRLLSDDGQVIAGTVQINRLGGPFRWSEAEGYQRLFSDLQQVGSVEGITADGSVIVGHKGSAGANTRAYYWNAEHGARDLADVLANDFGFGDKLAEWTFEEATGISADGRTIVGTAFAPNRGRFGFVATVPEPSAAMLALLSGVALALYSRFRRRSFFVAAIGIALAILGLGPLTSQAVTPSFTFIDRPTWSDAPYGTTATSISGDGRFVVGISGYKAFQWSKETGYVELGYLPGDRDHAAAFGVSFDGSIVVGASGNTNGDWEPFRWTADTGMHNLGNVPGGAGSDGWANGISADGKTIVGDNSIGAFHWNADEGMMPFGDASTPIQGSATAASSDGSVVVGMTWTPIKREAFRWTPSLGVELLGILPGGEIGRSPFSTALDVSYDGQVIVGTSYAANGGIEAFRWTADDGMIGLGDFESGMPLSDAYAVSADGSIIIGTGHIGGKSHAALWRGTSGPFSIRDILERYGLGDRIGPTTLSDAIDISADGRTILGRSGQGSWIATVPEPNCATLTLIGCAILATSLRGIRYHQVRLGSQGQ